MSTVPITFRLSSERKSQLDNAATALERKPAWIVAKAVEAYLDQRETKLEAIRAALVEAEAGVFVSSDAVHEWLCALDDDPDTPFPEPDVFPN